MISLPTKKDIEQAREVISEVLKKPTPLHKLEEVSERVGMTILAKREDLLHLKNGPKGLVRIKSYKARGAYYKIATLTEAEKRNGVVCASAGNHAQGFAFACSHLGIKGAIFMPKNTPKQKINKTRTIGGNSIEIHLVGDTFDEAKIAAEKFRIENNLTFIHPFDDLDIITGQATVAAEIFEQAAYDQEEIGAIFCPVGGGGLATGTFSAIRAYRKKSVQLIGVEPEGAPSMSTSLKLGKNTSVKITSTKIDGAAVGKVGDIAFDAFQKYNIPVIVRPEGSIFTTQLQCIDDQNVVEPAGALALDAILHMDGPTLEHLRKTHKSVVAIMSGGNFDFKRFASIEEESLVYRGLKKYYTIYFPNRAGALREFLDFLDTEANITHFNFHETPGDLEDPVHIGIQVEDPKSFIHLEKMMRSKGFSFDQRKKRQR